LALFLLRNKPIVDSENFLVSIFIVSEKKFDRQFNKKFVKVEDLDGETVSPHIQSPAEPFWRHPSLCEKLYHIISKKTNGV
jgi:hypothetical protein